MDNLSISELEDTTRKVRENFIMDLKDVSGHDGVKGVGEVDENPFMKECEMDKEQKKISKEMIEDMGASIEREEGRGEESIEREEELKKVLKEKNEELKKVTKEKKEKLKKVGMEMNLELEELEDTIREAREKYIIEMKDVSGDGVMEVGEVDESIKLESAMLCFTLQEEAVKVPNEPAASGQVRKPNARYNLRPRV